MQPKSEECFFVSFSPKLLFTEFIISALVNADLYFNFKALGFQNSLFPCISHKNKFDVIWLKLKKL